MKLASTQLADTAIHAAMTVASQSAGNGDDVEQQLGGRDGGLGTSRTLSWIGRRNTAPQTPTGAATVATASPTAKLSTSTAAIFTSALSPSSKLTASAEHPDRLSAPE